MILFKDNKEPFNISNAEIIEKFKQSDFYKDRTRDLDVRLALFISSNESKGLNSTFIGGQFKKLMAELKPY